MKKDKRKHDPIFKAGQKAIAKTQKQLSEHAPLTPEQVHEVRICTKKVRALLQLYRPFCGKTAIKAVEQKVKKLADGLAGSRDAHVLQQTLSQLAKAYGSDQDIQPLMEYFAQLNEKAQRTAPTVHPAKSLKNIEEAWKNKIRPKREPDFDEGMEFSYQKARKLAFDAESSDQDETYHECRKWAKYYLYQLQMSHYKKQADTKAHIALVKQLAELLGQFHDRCVLESALNDLLQGKAKRAQALETAALLMLSYLAEQKRLDKERCHRFFESLFSYSCNPIVELAS